ncbi:DNA adenine methylase [Legionella busanensis]|uniref:Site-specific DNA-methyltransferase (adenine-specific) n=1 Tax=Legionella busanensis TaxID=190655 RepID=A0A378JWK2_9GAMM|nr:Dam family site-specific DNA-(adenine-N6)-methyltransferase [Legionella busanensis]STX52602.1 DNA adenine methylase [Legionella busanensis]
MTKVKPFLKWAGSKFRCLDIILSELPQAKRLIEPFAGSGAIFINSNYSNYLLAEQNQDLVLMFQTLQQEGLNFIDYCEQFFTSTNNSADRYYQLREQFNHCKGSRLRAALFLYLNRHGYNGLCRYNKKGVYNVPFGRYTKPYFPRAEMLFFHQKSQAVKFLQSDFRATFKLAEPGDIIYCDPPYVPLSASANFSSYTQFKFTEQDHIELAQLAKYSAGQGITVIISNHDTAFTRHHYQESEIISFPVKRFISCQSLSRRPAQELMAIFKGDS